MALLPESILRLKERTLDLSNQEGAITATVLDRACDALYVNENFRIIDLSNNPLGDDCVATLSALIKDRNFVTTYNLTNCGIRDRQLILHLIPALLLKNCITCLILDKNKHLTEECVDSLVSLIMRTPLAELSLAEIHFSRAAGERIRNAVERSRTLITCRMSFSIGYQLLNSIEVLLERNRDAVAYEREFQQGPNSYNDSSNLLPKMRRNALRRLGTMKLEENLEERKKITNGSAASYRSSEENKLPYLFLDKELKHSKSTVNSWADPAVKNTLISLHLLAEKSEIERHKRNIFAARRNELLGLAPKMHRT